MHKKTAAPAPQRSFRWGVRTIDLGLLQPGPAEAVLEGSSNDCGCAEARYEPRRRAPRPRRSPR